MTIVRRHHSPQWQVGMGLLLLLAWTGVGVAGYLVIEDGWSVLDAFYMTVISVSTVGYREVHPLSPAGQIFTSVLVIVGLGILLYTLTKVAQTLFEGELVDFLGKRRMMREISELEKHYIVCGFGKVGRPVAEGLKRERLPLCVVERDPDLEGTLHGLEIPYVIGDATDEDVLRQAGLERARTILGLLPSDADNLYLTITAKDLNPGIKVIARAGDQSGEVRLKRVGADDVVSPTQIAGLRVLQAAVNPTAVEFMEIVTQQQALQLSLADIPIQEASPLNGQTIAECGVRGRYGVIIVAIKREQTMKFNPDPDHRITAGDVLVVLGEDMDIVHLQIDAGGE